MTTAVARGIKPLGARRRPAYEGVLDVKSLTVTPPYMGYCPDLNPSLTNLVFFEDCQGIVNEDGVLTLDSGWYRYQDDDVPTLPLGGLWNGAANVAEAPVTLQRDAQPIILLCELSRSDGEDPKRVPFAATGLSTIPVAGPPGTATVGFCWYYDGASWVNVPWDLVGTYGNAIGGNRDNVFDWAHYPIGGTIIAPATVNPGLIFFTNFVDQVYKWDPGTGGFPGEYESAFGAFGQGEGAPFHAKSVDLLYDRLVFLYTQEDGDLFNKRARWTNIAAIPDLTSAGSGFIDFTEFRGDGLRVLSFQDTCACYFEDGVSLLWRTDNPTNPFRRTYLTKERGLIGTHAVCRVNNDLHFGIFEDGWFFLSAGGSWQEAGMVDTGAGKATKWSRKFYELLNVTEKDTTTVSFDSFTRRIRISFPTTGEHQDEGVGAGDPGATVTTYFVWIYDLDTDSVWPDEPYNPVCWTDIVATLNPGVEWGDFVGTWGNATGTWGDYAPVFGDRVILHGTEGGLIHLHSPALLLRDASEEEGAKTPINWFVETHKDIFADQYAFKSSDRLLVQHMLMDPESDLTGTFEAFVVSVNGDINGDVINMQLGGAGRATTTIHPLVSGYAIGNRFEGSSPIRIYDWQLSLKPSMVADKEPGG